MNLEDELRALTRYFGMLFPIWVVPLVALSLLVAPTSIDSAAAAGAHNMGKWSSAKGYSSIPKYLRGSSKKTAEHAKHHVKSPVKPGLLRKVQQRLKTITVLLRQIKTEIKQLKKDIKQKFPPKHNVHGKKAAWGGAVWSKPNPW